MVETWGCWWLPSASTSCPVIQIIKYIFFFRLFNRFESAAHAGEPVIKLLPLLLLLSCAQGRFRVGFKYVFVHHNARGCFECAGDGMMHYGVAAAANSLACREYNAWAGGAWGRFCTTKLRGLIASLERGQKKYIYPRANRVFVVRFSQNHPPGVYNNINIRTYAHINVYTACICEYVYIQYTNTHNNVCLAGFDNFFIPLF